MLDKARYNQTAKIEHAKGGVINTKLFAIFAGDHFLAAAVANHTHELLMMAFFVPDVPGNAKADD